MAPALGGHFREKLQQRSLSCVRQLRGPLLWSFVLQAGQFAVESLLGQFHSKCWKSKCLRKDPVWQRLHLWMNGWSYTWSFADGVHIPGPDMCHCNLTMFGCTPPWMTLPKPHVSSKWRNSIASGPQCFASSSTRSVACSFSFGTRQCHWIRSTAQWNKQKGQNPPLKSCLG